jgi:hypothetical protein
VDDDFVIERCFRSVPLADTLEETSRAIFDNVSLPSLRISRKGLVGAEAEANEFVFERSPNESLLIFGKAKCWLWFLLFSINYNIILKINTLFVVLLLCLFFKLPQGNFLICCRSEYLYDTLPPHMRAFLKFFTFVSLLLEAAILPFFIMMPCSIQIHHPEMDYRAHNCFVDILF